MFELIEGEFLKLKRSRMFTITLLGSLVPAILLLVMMIKNQHLPTAYYLNNH